jgi:hypothetical protein
MKRGIILIAAVVILMCCLWGTASFGTTIPYEFVQNESTVLIEGEGPYRYYSIEGQFVLNVDFDVGIASFDQVNATLSGEITYWETAGSRPSRTNNLDVLFKLTELESVYVSDTKIDFYLDRNLPMFPDSNIRLSVTFMGDSLNMTGYFSAPVFDGASYTLNATAVPEPGTLLLLAFGGIMSRRRS